MGQFIKLIPLIIALINLAEKLFTGPGKGGDKKDFVLGGVEAGARIIAKDEGAEVQDKKGWAPDVGKIIDAVVKGQNATGPFSTGG